MKAILTASALLLIAFAIGWLVKPRPEAPAPQAPLRAQLGDSLLERTLTPRAPTQTNTATHETLTALVEIYGENRYTGEAKAYQHVSHLATAELRSLAESLQSFKEDPGKIRLLIQLIVGRWGEVDPEGLLAYARESPLQDFKNRGVYHAIEVIAQQAPQRARALIDTIEDDDLHRQASRQVALATAKDDPAATFAALRQDPTSTYAYDDLFLSWGKAAPHEAVEHLKAITSDKDRRQAIQGLARSWGKAEPEAAFQWATALSNLQERNQAIQSVLGSVTDIDQGAQLLERLGLNGSSRREAIRAFASNAFHADIDRALSWLKSLPQRDQTHVLEYQLESISEKSPERAIQLFESNMSDRLSSAAGVMARQLATADLARAQSWVDSLPPGRAKESALLGILKGLQHTSPEVGAAYLDQVGIDNSRGHLASGTALAWFDRDQEAALAWVESQDDPRVAQQLTSEILNHWSQQDPAAAVAYADRIEDPATQDRALQRCLANWASINPKEAIAHYQTLQKSDDPTMVATMIGAMAHADIDAASDLLESSLNSHQSESSQSGLAASADNLVSKWAEFDVTAAAEWSATLSQPDARKRAIQRSSAEWIQQDSMAASEWIGKLPAGPGRDSAVSNLVSHIKQDDPSAAFVWANTIGHDNERMNELINLVRQWKQTDPLAARQALHSANLSGDTYDSLAKLFE